MIRKRERKGFTLVELLVVISIIGMLVAMLLPAVQAAREAARRTECMNKQRQLGLALHQYDSAKGRFPGFFGWIGKDRRPAQTYPYRCGSWIVSLFPYMGQMPLWEVWSMGMAGDSIANLEAVHCPSMPNIDSAGETTFSYQVNTGRHGLSSYDLDTNTFGVQSDDITAFGVFDVDIPSDFAGGDPPTIWPEFAKRRAMSLNTLRDGATNTLMLSENTQEGQWNSNYAATSAAEFRTNLLGGEVSLGFCIPQTASTNSSGEYPLGLEYLNQNFDDPQRCLPRSDNSYGTYGGAPGSYHPTGLVVVFCDNRGYFLSDQIDLPVFLHIMTPNSRRAAYEAFDNTWPFYPLMLKDPTDKLSGMTMLDDSDY